jgi:hypothetical protein
MMQKTGPVQNLATRVVSVTGATVVISLALLLALISDMGGFQA